MIEHSSTDLLLCSGVAGAIRSPCKHHDSRAESYSIQGVTGGDTVRGSRVDRENI